MVQWGSIYHCYPLYCFVPVACHWGVPEDSVLGPLFFQSLFCLFVKLNTLITQWSSSMLMICNSTSLSLPYYLYFTISFSQSLLSACPHFTFWSALMTLQSAMINQRWFFLQPLIANSLAGLVPTTRHFITSGIFFLLTWLKKFLVYWLALMEPCECSAVVRSRFNNLPCPDQVVLSP